MLAKTAADQLIWAPVMTCVFFAVLKTLEGHPEMIMSTIEVGSACNPPTVNECCACLPAPCAQHVSQPLMSTAAALECSRIKSRQSAHAHIVSAAAFEQH